MADGAELRVHPTGTAVLRVSCQTQGQGHETTFAQIVAEEIGIPPGDIKVVHGDTDQTPFGLGTYGSRSTPVSGAAAVAGRPQGAGQGAAHRRGDARGLGGRPRVGRRARFHVVGRPGQVGHHPGDRPAGLRRRRPARRRRGRPRGPGPLRPREPHLPPRRLHLRRRRRPGHRGRHRAPVHRGRRLRHPDQPDDHRGAGAPRPHRRRRHGADGDDRLRRGRQLPRRVADGLPAADRARGARLGDRLHRHPVAAPPDRRQGGGGVGDRRLAAGGRQRGRRRAHARTACATPTCR